MLTESHLNDEIKDAEIKIDGYKIYRADRKNFKQGGAIIYLKTSLNLGARELCELSHNMIEMKVLLL